MASSKTDMKLLSKTLKGTLFFSNFRPQKIIWHGSASNGERDLDTYCDAWQSSMSDKFGLASNLLGNKLLDQERYSCDNRFVVLCIEALTQDRRKRRRRDVHG